MRKSSIPEFWVTNTSTERDVALGDLRITVRRCKTINLLSKYYHFTLEELEKSAATGSLYKKSNVIKVRRTAPKPIGKMVREIEKRRVLKPIRNAVQVTEKKWEELDLPDMPINLEETAAASDIDHRPRLAVDKKYFQDDVANSPEENYEYDDSGNEPAEGTGEEDDFDY
jgi:hypothetical protein